MTIDAKALLLRTIHEAISAGQRNEGCEEPLPSNEDWLADLRPILDRLEKLEAVADEACVLRDEVSALEFCPDCGTDQEYGNPHAESCSMSRLHDALETVGKA